MKRTDKIFTDKIKKAYYSKTPYGEAVKIMEDFYKREKLSESFLKKRQKRCLKTLYSGTNYITGGQFRYLSTAYLSQVKLVIISIVLGVVLYSFEEVAYNLKIFEIGFFIYLYSLFISIVDLYFEDMIFVNIKSKKLCEYEITLLEKISL